MCIRGLNCQPIKVWRVIWSKKLAILFTRKHYWFCTQSLCVTLELSSLRYCKEQARDQTTQTLPRNFCTGRAIKLSDVLESSSLFKSCPQMHLWDIKINLSQSIFFNILWRQIGSNETWPKQKSTTFKYEKSAIISFLPVCQTEKFSLEKQPAKSSRKIVLDNNPLLMKLHGGYITNADFIKNLI